VSRRTTFLTLVFVVAVTIRLVVLAGYLPKLNPNVDMDSYHSLARNLVAGKGYVSAGQGGREMPNVGRTPLYPLLLAGLMKVGGDRLGLFLSVQCVLWGMIAVVTVVLATRWLSLGAATLAGLIVALDPNCVTRAIDLRTETLFTLLLVGGVCVLAWRGRQPSGWFWSGLLWSLAALCRPIALLLWIVGLVLALVWRVRWVCWATFLIGFLPLIALWAARNAAVTGQWFFSTNGTDNLLLSWACGVEASQRGVSVETMQRELVPKVGLAEMFDDRESFTKRLQTSKRTSLNILLGAPGVVFREAAKGWGKLLLGPGSRTLDPSLREPRPPARWWPPLYSAALCGWVLLSVIGLWKLGRSALLPGIVLLYFIGLAGGPVSYSRYRVPITPLMAILAVAGCVVKRTET